MSRSQRTFSLASPLRFCCAVALLALTPTSSARAEEPASAASAVAPRVPEEKMQEARRQFEAGVNLLDDPDGARYEQAYRAFKKAYDLTRSPKVLGNIAFCAMKLERDGEAIDSYATYLREVFDIDERERTQIQRDLATLTATVARLEITPKTLGGTFVVVDKRSTPQGAVENQYAFAERGIKLRVRPGRHTVVLRAADGSESTPLEVTLEPGSNARHEVSFSPPSAPGGALRQSEQASPRAPSLAGPVAVGAAGVLALGVGIVSGSLAHGKTRDIETRCPNDTCPADYDLAADRTEAKTLGTVADVSFVGGGVLLGGALLWYLLVPRSAVQPTAPSGAKKPGWGSSGACTRDGCTFLLQRGF